MCIHTCAHVGVGTSLCVCACSRLQEHVTVSASPAKMNYLAHICLCPGVGGENSALKALQSLGALHDTTPTIAFCHLSHSMEIEQTARGCWASQNASRQSLQKEGCRLTPHLSQRRASENLEHPSPRKARHCLWWDKCSNP